MADYFLPRHVFYGLRGDAAVFLDLRQDDYTLVNGDAAAILRNLAGDARGCSERARSDADVLLELLTGGLLTTDRSGKAVAPTKVEAATVPLVDPACIQDADISIAHVLQFLSACTSASLQLRLRTLEHVVRRIQRRKSAGSRPRQGSTNKMRSLAATFLKLRIFFPRNYLCLYDSLALLEYLAAHRMYPTWVFGVKLEPWAAHCWIQHEQYTINEGVEEAAGYTPVMVI